MKATEGQVGRVFVMRLEDGDVVPGCIERFAEEKGISVGHAIMLGGMGAGQVVASPRDSGQLPPDPMLLPVEGAHETLGIGVIAPGDDGKPKLHMHGALGRSGHTLTGCLRNGVTTWVMAEVVIYEILGTRVARLTEKESGLAGLRV